MIRLIRKSLLSLAAVLAIGTLAQADVICYGPTAFGSYAAGASGGFTMPSFDTNLGTLTKVEVTVNGYSDGGSNSIQNLSAKAGTATVNIGTDITVSGPSALSVLTLPQSTNTGPVTAFVGPALDFSGSDSVQVFGSPSTDNDSSSIVVGLAAYETVGPGTVNFNYSSSANTSNATDVAPTVSVTAAPTFSYDVEVCYYYNAVPEPGSIALLGMGAVGLIVIAKKRRRTA